MNLTQKIIQTIRNWLYPPVKVRDVPYRINRLARQLEVEQSRRAIVTQCREMYATDPRCEGLIDKLASDSVRGGFTLTVKNSPLRQAQDTAQAQAIADDLVKRLSLSLRLDDWLRMAQRDGDLFLELSLDGRDITGVTRKPSLEMHRNSDDTDQFENPEAAYWQAEELWFMTPPGNSVWFADWQIIHARWNHDAGERYGKPQFASAVGAWKKLIKGEENVTIRRMVRSGMRLYHYVEGGFANIARYREENKYALDNPAEAAIDFFGNAPEGPKVLQGDANLEEIGDVKHHLYTWATATPVPLHSLGYGDDLNRDVLEDQHKQYELALPQVTEWIEVEVMRPLIELQWLLYGLYPGNIEYSITWKRDELDEAQVQQQQIEASRLKAEAVSKAAEAGQRLMALGWSQESVAQVVKQILAEVEMDIRPRLERQNTPERLAITAQESLNKNGNGFLKEASKEMRW